MTSAMDRSGRASFIVRLVADRHGHLGGVVERVATGAKETFSDLDAIGSVIKGMLVGAPEPCLNPRGGGAPRDVRRSTRRTTASRSSVRRRVNRG